MRAAAAVMCVFVTAAAAAVTDAPTASPTGDDDDANDAYSVRYEIRISLFARHTGPGWVGDYLLPGLLGLSPPTGPAHLLNWGPCNASAAHLTPHNTHFLNAPLSVSTFAVVSFWGE